MRNRNVPNCMPNGRLAELYSHSNNLAVKAFRRWLCWACTTLWKAFCADHFSENSAGVNEPVAEPGKIKILWGNAPLLQGLKASFCLGGLKDQFYLADSLLQQGSSLLLNWSLQPLLIQVSSSFFFNEYRGHSICSHKGNSDQHLACEVPCSLE